MVSKRNLEKLAEALFYAADFAKMHADTVREAERVFEEVFGVDVPEESFSISGSDSAEEVGSLFNNFVNHNENMSGTDTSLGLAQKMAELMKKAKKEHS